MKHKPEKIPLRNYAAAMLEDFLTDYKLSQRALAEAIKISPQRINDILAERRQITPEIALRLGRYFGNRPQYWLDLQTQWLLLKAEDETEDVLASILPLATV